MFLYLSNIIVFFIFILVTNENLTKMLLKLIFEQFLMVLNFLILKLNI